MDGLQTSFRREFHEEVPWDEKMSGVTGARGVGKTTIILQHIKQQGLQGKSHLYVSLDDISFPFENLVQLAETFEKEGGRFLYIDEVHKYRNWSQELKNIYDQLPAVNVMFTGSSMLDIARGQADLSRRAVVNRLQGLSFREFLNIEAGLGLGFYSLDEILARHEEIARDIVSQVKPFAWFDQYLMHGYYPYYLQSKQTYMQKLGATINQTVESDLVSMYNINVQYIDKIKRFLNLLSSHIPYKPNISKLSAAIGISWQSVVQYLRYLDEAEIIRIIYQEGKDTRAMSKPEMVYLHHPNHFYVFGQEAGNKGNIREAFFLNQVCYRHKVEKASRGDFIVDDRFTFEIGGKNKTYHQIAGVRESYIASDDNEYGFENKIPLWLFGFLY
ncbi:MAG: AAA family ATPase [Bacteroidales bacterium]